MEIIKILKKIKKWFKKSLKKHEKLTDNLPKPLLKHKLAKNALIESLRKILERERVA